MPNNNKKTRGGNLGSQSNQGNPGVGHSSGSSTGTINREDRGSRGNADRGNQGMGDHGSSRRSENIDSDRSSGK